MFYRRKKKNQFPVDFYGEEGSWRFVIRAMCQNEIIDAMYWCAHISCHRKDFDLLHIASDKFDCRYNYSTADLSDLQFGLSGTPLKVTMMGPIVLMSTIKQHFVDTEMDHESEQSASNQLHHTMA
ncbi:hypothetical protein C9J21_00485 [Photobacterium phosphoreum]|uniref:Uncharacterized protein n=1 Tax=Photobacterium phosphoreum TaxID=659 RepID=A0A2T3JVX7_PHOPO|nr:hypothetical protein [Photobacterium phosphoreum]PSU26890.1 hypothetical protein CTM96_04810 [Photobacterium phosphoreum]PSU44301.1 hypothetical protein CTM97_00095 [Photobacterium phosphoreum]PSU53451.1 hypothetical protein C9J18_03280 [Photobacterium phosphoreum]PSU72722.1 hypothetical protein C9J22_01870 [Photobacterium phosphoreum]PSW35579.1 hypothetical protein C9J21_00485 [Photobacterium phosphoreum]